MKKTIIVAGATGNLGMRIVSALIKRGTDVIALSRIGTNAKKILELETLGAKVAIVDMKNFAEIARVCSGSACVISALAGLRDVIVDSQSILLEGAVAAQVPRFIPSDFSIDFTNLIPGENRNFDLRREFQSKLDSASIASTSIYNGAFAEVLTYSIPILDFKKQEVGYWEDPDYYIDFTTMDNTAAYTAATALDSGSPRALHIASFQISPRELVAFTEEKFGIPYKLVRLGSLDDIRTYNKSARAAYPEGESELYAGWQQSQYLQSMFSTHHESIDNDRYGDIHWTALRSIFQ